MRQFCFVSLLTWLLIAARVTGAAEVEDVSVASEKEAVAALEKDWADNRKAGYFRKAFVLFRSRNAEPKINSEFFKSQLDIASGALLRSFDGFEFGSDASAVRRCQAEIVDRLANVDISKMKQLSSWPELRAQYGRLLMIQRATWLSLRDPDLDGKPIELDSTLRLQTSPEDVVRNTERIARNIKIALQFDLKRFLKELGPEIDKFMVASFSDEPKDMRMFNALLAMGLYTHEERAKLTAAMEKNTGKH